MQLLKQLRQGNFVLNEWLAATDIVSATASALATRNIQVGYGDYADAWFNKIFSGAYYMIDRAVNSLPMSGRVPVSLFQLLAAIRSRPVELSPGRGFTLNVSLSGATSPAWLPTLGSIDAQRAGFSELMQCYAQLGGVLVDLSGLCDSGELNAGKIGKISFGKSLGPLNLGQTNASLGNIQITRISQVYPVTETWMKYVDWLDAIPTGIFFDQVVDQLKFPAQTGSYVGNYQQLIRPATVVLARSFSNAAVMQCTKIDFPVVDLPQLAACIQADANARGITVTSTTDFTLGAYLLVARIGVESGILAYVPALFAQTNYQIPQVLCEAMTITGSFRNGQARLPLPVAGIFNDLTRLEYPVAADGTVQNPLNLIIDTNGYVGWVKPQTGYLLSGGTMANADVNSAWGTVPASTAIPSPFDLTTFSLTIGKGPLGQPGVDRSVGKLNMNDVFAEYAVNSSNKFVTIVSVCSNGKRGHDVNFKLLSLFPLMKPFFLCLPPPVLTYYIGEETPQRREIILLPRNVVNYVNAAVTEQSAKYTELQAFIQDLNEKGLGGAAILGDLAGGFGRVMRGVSKIAGLGHPTAGRILEVGADMLITYEGHGDRDIMKNRKKQKKVKASVISASAAPSRPKTARLGTGRLGRKVAVTPSKRSR
jgi:hypothetical protein